VGVPHARLALLRFQVPLDHDGTTVGALALKDDVADLDATLIARLANLEDCLGLLRVGEAFGDEQRPDLANHLEVLGHLDRILDDVRTVVDVSNLVTLDAVKILLNTVGVVILSITLAAESLDRLELGNWDVLVLRLGAAKDVLVGIEQRLGLGGAGDRTGGALLLEAVVAVVHVSVTGGPGLDDLASGLQEVLATGVLNRVLDTTGHVDVVEDEVAARSRNVVLLKPSDVDTDGSAADLTVREDDRADSLVGRVVCHVEADVTVVDGDVGHGPAPVPVEVDGSVLTGELEVANSELLAAQEGTDVTTLEFKVAGPTAAAVVHEDTKLLVSGRLGVHGELHVLQRCGLGDLPVNAGAGGFGHASEIDFEVANLAEEVVLVGPPVAASVVVRVRIQYGHTNERGCSSNDRAVDSIADDLSVIVHLDGCGDNVGALGEVDNSRSDGGRVAPRVMAATLDGGTLSIADGAVDSFGVVARTIAFGAVVLDVTEDLVVVITPDRALAFNGLHPEG